MSASIQIGGHRIGPGSPTFVIAEVGVNHNGEPQLAHQLIDAAAAAGADAVKFQTFTPELLAAPDAPQADYQRDRSPDDSQVQMLSRLALDAPTFASLRDHADRAGILFMSSPFDEASVDLLEDLAVPAYKIPSGELTNHPLLRRISATGRPIIMSTGMSRLAEIDAAVGQLGDGRDRLALLHCVSAYPADAGDCNLRAMETLRSTFKVPVGWSDHVIGTVIASAAVALGANVIEKHITLDRTMSGPDHAASTEPDKFAAMVSAFRAIESALGSAEKVPTEAEIGMANVARKSLHWRRSLPAGTVIEDGDLIAQRPGTGISPAQLSEVLGRRTSQATVAGSLVRFDDLSVAEPGSSS